MYAFIIVSCASAVLLSDDTYNQYKCVVGIPKAAEFATEAECEAEKRITRSEVAPPADMRVFLFCVRDE